MQRSIPWATGTYTAGQTELISLSIAFPFLFPARLCIYQLMFAQCHVQPFQTSFCTGQWDWQCTTLPELSMRKRGKSSEKSEGGLSEARLLWIRLHYHLWPKHGPGFVRYGLMIIVSVMGSGKTEHQRRERDGSYIRDNTVVGAMFITFPWGSVKETSLGSISTTTSA